MYYEEKLKIFTIYLVWPIYASLMIVIELESLLFIIILFPGFLVPFGISHSLVNKILHKRTVYWISFRNSRRRFNPLDGSVMNPDFVMSPDFKLVDYLLSMDHHGKEYVWISQPEKHIPFVLRIFVFFIGDEFIGTKGIAGPVDSDTGLLMSRDDFEMSQGIAQCPRCHYIHNLGGLPLDLVAFKEDWYRNHYPQRELPHLRTHLVYPPSAPQRNKREKPMVCEGCSKKF